MSEREREREGIGRVASELRSEHVSSDIAAIEAELTRVVEEDATAKATIAALEEERAAAEDRIRLLRRAADEFEQRLEAKRLELREAHREEAETRFEDALRQRTETAEAFAKTLRQALATLGALDRSRSDVMVKRESLRVFRSEDGGQPVDLPDELEFRPGGWERLLEALQRGPEGPSADAAAAAAARQRMEEDLLNAAAKGGPWALQKLPEHLREEGRRRRQAYTRAGRLAGQRGAASEE